MSNFLSKWHAHKIRCWLLYLKPRVAKQSENVNKSLCLAWGVVVMSWEELWNSLLFGSTLHPPPLLQLQLLKLQLPLKKNM